MTSLISKKDIYKNNQNNKYSIVVAHPDDEILWASSICQNASQVIICFSEDENSQKISKGRKIFQKFAPNNFIFLNIKEPPQKGTTFIPNKSHIRNCISDISFKQIKNLLYNFIDSPNVYTHNFWGEYGHPQHIAVHLAVKSICKERKIKCKIFSYFNLRTLPLRNYYLRKNYIVIEKKKVLKNYFYTIKNQYIKNNIWTFQRSYSPPNYEYFYEINTGRKNNNLVKNKICGTYIFWGELQYKFNLKQISVKHFRILFLILFVDLLPMPLYFLKKIYNNLLKFFK